MPAGTPDAAAPLLLTPAAVRRLLAAGERVTVLDARGSAAYAKAGERVAGDLRLPPREAGARAAELPRDGWLLAYCTCLGDGLAVRVAERLRASGLPRAAAIAGGLDGCREAGLRVVAIDSAP